MSEARYGPIVERLSWVRLPQWSVYGLAGLFLAIGLALPWLATGLGLLDFGEAKPSQALRPEMILLPRGTFTMGGSGADEQPVRQVTVSSFYLCRTEVTQSQWEAVMGDNPSDCEYGCDPDAPVQNVSWLQATLYLNKLSTMQGLQRCYRVHSVQDVTWRDECDGYRLPTEAEWEYAARAGTTTEYSFGDDFAQADEYAWHRGNSGGTVHPVERKRMNPWGFFDIHGNVWEWVWDRHDGSGYPAGDTQDPRGVESGEGRVSRGGSFGGDGDLRSAVRAGRSPASRHRAVGFRCARSAPSASSR